MSSERVPSSRKFAAGNVFIKNLDKCINSEDLSYIFSAFGNVLSAKVATDEKSESKGYGFVHFQSEEAANNAILKANGLLLNGKRVYVGKFIPREGREKMLEEKARRFRNVYIKNFGDYLDDEKLRELFEKYGKITSAKVETDEYGISRGFGFVSFQEPENAAKAVEDLNGKVLNGKVLYVGRSQKKSERKAELERRFGTKNLESMNSYQGVNLYVKNLDEDVDDEYLRKEFAPYGNVTSAKVLTDDLGHPKGYGLIGFASPEEANCALMEMDGKTVLSKPVSLAIARIQADNRFTKGQCICY